MKRQEASASGNTEIFLIATVAVLCIFVLGLLVYCIIFRRKKEEFKAIVVDNNQVAPEDKEKAADDIFTSRVFIDNEEKPQYDVRTKKHLDLDFLAPSKKRGKAGATGETNSPQNGSPPGTQGQDYNTNMDVLESSRSLNYSARL